MANLAMRVDARTETAEQLLARRRQIIELYSRGIPVMEIAKQTDSGWAVVNRAIALFQEGGDAALMPAKRGRKEGTGRALTPEQELAICTAMRVAPPDPDTDGLLWSRAAVGRLIKARFDLDLSDRSLGEYLERWQLAPPQAGARGFDRCSTAMLPWLEEHYENIEIEARNKGAEIFWVTKVVRLKSDQWGPLSSEESARLGVVFVIANAGEVRWKIFPGNFGKDHKMALLRAVIADKRRLTYLIRTDASVLRGRSDYSNRRNAGKEIHIFPREPVA
jgi:transposase